MDNNYRAQGLSLRLGKRQVIDQVSLTLRGGEMTALIGPNGAGKSTLLRLLTGFLTPDSGERMMDGKALERWSPQALSRRRAVMSQRTQLQADWTVETVIAMGRSPWEATASPQTLHDIMAETGCDHLRGRRYPSLSGGEQQRVQLARCLAQLWQNGAPQGWLFLDEPTSALDLYYQQHLLRLLKRLTASGQLHVCVVLHDLNLACGPTRFCCCTRDRWSRRARRIRLSSRKSLAAGTARTCASASIRKKRFHRFIWRPERHARPA